MSGKTFVEAFTAKYLVEEEEEEGDTDFGADSGIVILCPKSKPGAHTFLRQVVLDRANITSAGNVKEVADKLQRATELDLSANQLGSWNVVESVVKFMPHLEFLNLASADLSKCSDADLSGCSDLSCKQRVKVFILNATNLSWSALLKILSCFPSVVEVHLSLNQLSSIPTPADGDGDGDGPRFRSVRKLYFNDNKVTEWSEIAKLGQFFPNVENLLLVKNPLSGLTEDIGGHFTCLKQLSVLDTNLSSWDDIDHLNHFPKLTEIQLRGIPLLKGLKEKEYRQLVVARLPNVAKLNNSPISQPEREDAERAFIRKFMDAPERPKRYQELFAVHKNVHRLAEVDMMIITSANLTITYGERTDQMTVSTEQTCLQLTKSLASHFGVSTSKIQLVYKSAKGDSEPEVLNSRKANLQWYNMRDGDELVVEDVPEDQKEKNDEGISQYSTFVEAFTTKYNIQEDSEYNLISANIIASSKEFQRMTHLDLSRKGLYAAGDCQPYADKLTNFTELDVSSTVLGCWTEVELIIKFMPKLEVLNLEGTLLNYVQEYLENQSPAATHLQQFRTIKVVNLKGTCLQWPFLLSALHSLPCVEELHFGVNQLEAISPPPEKGVCFGSVKKLYLNSNKLSDWSQFVVLGKLFPGVEILHLERNPLLGLTEDVGGHFPSLTRLNIADTDLSSWDEIDNLNHFPKLDQVHLKGVALLQDPGFGGILSRQLLVARLPKVNKLDNSSISESEREFAERAFIEHYAGALEKPARYAELVAVHLNSPKAN